MMDDQAKSKVQNRLNRIAGQVEGLQRMVSDDRYCVDILTQVAAVRSALHAVGVAVLCEHIRGCIVGYGTEAQHPDADGKTMEQLIEEVSKVLDHFPK